MVFYIFVAVFCSYVGEKHGKERSWRAQRMLLFAMFALLGDISTRIIS